MGLNLKPGQRGPRKLYVEYSQRLVPVRCQRRTEKPDKTVEIIVEQSDWWSRRKADMMVKVRGWWGESELAQKVNECRWGV